MPSKSHLIKVRLDLVEASPVSNNFIISNTQFGQSGDNTITGLRGNYKFIQTNTYELDVILDTTHGPHRFMGTTNKDYLWSVKCECLAEEIGLDKRSVSEPTELGVKTMRTGKRSGEPGSPVTYSGVDWLLRVTFMVS